MVVTILSVDSFKSEAKRWGINPDSLIRIRMKRRGQILFFRFAVPNTSEILETRISVEDYTDFDFMELGPISMPAVWVDESEQLDRLNRQMEELNAKQLAPDINNRQGTGQISTV